MAKVTPNSILNLLSQRSFSPGKNEKFRVKINWLEKASQGVQSVSQRPQNER